jgi:NAD(P)-dependent dehydrogenase (short-subunit alcohol dehydrogenase family)
MRVVSHFGAIDILVNNAGIAFREPAEETSEDKWDLTMAVNLKAVFLLSKAVGRHFLDQGHGKIINIASQAAVVALANHLAYCTSNDAPNLRQKTHTQVKLSSLGERARAYYSFPSCSYAR